MCSCFTEWAGDEREVEDDWLAFVQDGKLAESRHLYSGAGWLGRKDNGQPASQKERKMLMLSQMGHREPR